MKWNFAQLYANSPSSITEWRLLLSRSWVYASKQVGTAMAKSFEDSSLTHTAPETSKYNHEKKKKKNQQLLITGQEGETNSPNWNPGRTSACCNSYDGRLLDILWQLHNNIPWLFYAQSSLIKRWLWSTPFNSTPISKREVINIMTVRLFESVINWRDRRCWSRKRHT